jgi:hypothetical protein
MVEVYEQPMSANERQRRAAIRAHGTLGRLLRRIPWDIPLWGLSVQGDLIDIRLNAMANDHATRAAVMQLAEQFGLTYYEIPLPGHDGRNKVACTGRYDDVPVKVWSLVAPCACEHCDHSTDTDVAHDGSTATEKRYVSDGIEQQIGALLAEVTV